VPLQNSAVDIITASGYDRVMRVFYSLLTIGFLSEATRSAQASAGSVLKGRMATSWTFMPSYLSLLEGFVTSGTPEDRLSRFNSFFSFYELKWRCDGRVRFFLILLFIPFT
jgi:hypothetical protein